MNILEDYLKLYQKYLDRADFLYKQDEYEASIEMYNNAIAELYNAREHCQYSDKIHTLASGDVKIRKWLDNKLLSIEKQLDSLISYKQQLQKSIDYVKNKQNDGGSSSVSVQENTKDTFPENAHKSSVNKSANVSIEKKRLNKSDRGKNKYVNYSSDESDDDNTNNDADNNNATLNWKYLAQSSIKLLCTLRGKYDFHNKDKEFQDILSIQRKLSKRR